LSYGTGRILALESGTGDHEVVDPMSAQPVEAAHLPKWLRNAPAHGWTVEDVLNLPEDAPRVELVDGEIRVVPSPTIGHQRVSGLIWNWLRLNAPSEYDVIFAVGVAINFRNTREPDVLLLQRDQVEDTRHFMPSDAVVLAVEVVSDGSKRVDRIKKPREYAAAGIPHYWRVELKPTITIHAYELRGESYTQVAEASDELVLERPFEIRLPIADITP